MNVIFWGISIKNEHFRQSSVLNESDDMFIHRQVARTYCSKSDLNHLLAVFLVEHSVVRAEKEFAVEQLHGDYGEDELE